MNNECNICYLEPKNCLCGFCDCAASKVLESSAQSNESWEEWEKRFSPCWNDKDKEWVSKQISEVEEKGFREGVEYCNTINEESHISNCECPPFNHEQSSITPKCICLEEPSMGYHAKNCSSISGLSDYFTASPEEKKKLINEVIKESSADQRLVMYKADLIRKLEVLKEHAANDMKHDLHGRCDYEKVNTLNEVIQIIKKQE